MEESRSHHLVQQVEIAELGLNWDLVRSRVQFYHRNFNLFNDIQEELFDAQASMRETTADKQHEEESKQKQIWESSA